MKFLRKSSLVLEQGRKLLSDHPAQNIHIHLSWILTPPQDDPFLDFPFECWKVLCVFDILTEFIPLLCSPVLEIRLSGLDSRRISGLISIFLYILRGACFQITFQIAEAVKYLASSFTLSQLHAAIGVLVWSLFMPMTNLAQLFTTA